MIQSLVGMFKDLMLFGSFVSINSGFPMPLSAEKEAEYIQKSLSGDKEATEILIKHNLRLVAHIAKKYQNYPDTDELISVGSIGLIKAVSTFNPQHGAGLATYAARCIENEILMMLRAGKKHLGNVSLSDAVGTDKDGGELTLLDLLAENDENVIANVETKLQIEKIMEVIRKVLSPREYQILVLRYGIGGGPELTQKEVAKKFGISRSYVSRIEKKALDKIREEIKDEF